MTTKTRVRKQSRVAKPESIVNDATREFTDADFPIGSVAHQGDVILVRIAKLPTSAKVRKNRQLADGNTQGSRHVLVGGKCFDADRSEVQRAIAATCRNCTIGEQYIGPVFVGGELTHPEHGNHVYQDDMVVACVYQRNLDAEERERRTVD